MSSQELAELRVKIDQLDTQVKELNQKHLGLIDFVLKGQSTVGTASASVPKMESTVKPTHTPIQSVFSSEKAATFVGSKTDFMSARLLPIVSVICFILAAIFIVKLAIESGWLDLERQWGLLNLLGLGLIGYGMFGPYIEDKHYRSYLASAGIVVLYIAALACKLYFGLFSTDFSIVLIGIISVVGVFLARHFESEGFLVITSLGAYLAPILLGAEKDLVFYAFYFLISSISFAAISIFLGSRVVSLVSSYFGLGAFALIHINVTESADLMAVIGVEILQFMIFTYGTYIYSITTKSILTKKMAMAFLPVLLFFYGVIYYFLDRLNSGMAPWVSLGFAGFLFFLYTRAKKQLVQVESQQLVFGFMSVVLAHSGYLQLLPSDTKPWMIPLVLVLGMIAERKANFPKIAPILKGTFIGLAALEYASLCLKLMTKGSDWKAVMPAMVAVALGYIYYVRGSKVLLNREQIFLGLIHTMAILMLYQLSYESGTLAVSFVWAAYSVSILAVGYFRREPFLAKSSLLVLVLTGLKALVYDASQAASGLRILSLLLTGVLLYGAGVALKKIKAW